MHDHQACLAIYHIVLWWRVTDDDGLLDLALIGVADECRPGNSRIRQIVITFQ